MYPTNCTIPYPQYPEWFRQEQPLIQRDMNKDFNDAAKTVTRTIEKYDADGNYLGKEVITETTEYKSPDYIYQSPSCVDNLFVGEPQTSTGQVLDPNGPNHCTDAKDK